MKSVRGTWGSAPTPATFKKVDETFAQGKMGLDITEPKR